MTAIQPFNTFRKQINEAAKSKKSDNHAHFDKKILIIGYGSVGQAILPLIIKHISNDPSKITVIEKDDNGKVFRKRNTGNGVKYIKKEILPNNLTTILKKYTEPGSFIVDVSLNISAKNIIEWCLQKDMLLSIHQCFVPKVSPSLRGILRIHIDAAIGREGARE